MADLVLNSDRQIKTKKKRSKSKSRSEDGDEEPLSAGGGGVRKATKAAFNNILQQAVEESKKENERPKKNKKKKRTNDLVTLGYVPANANQSKLERLKKGEGIAKDEEDATLLANTFDPDDDKGLKSNKRREKEMKQRQGQQNLAYDDKEVDAVPLKGKKKKTTKMNNSNADQDRTMTIADLAPPPVEDEASTPVKKKKKKKKLQPESYELEDQPEQGHGVEMYRGDDLDQSEDRLTPDDLDEDQGKPRVKKKKKKKKKAPIEEEELEEGQGEEVAGAAAAEMPRVIEDQGQIVGVTVHRTDKLKTDFFISHPLVRISVVDMGTGNYLKKQTSERPVTSYYENRRADGEGESKVLDFIQPIMTHPFDFKQQKSTLPVWEEIVIFNENYNYFIEPEPKVIIFYELLDFVSMNTARVKYNTAKQEGGWHRIAWAFLKVLGANGMPNTNKKIRLQLYQPPFRFRPKEGSLEVFQWWKSNQWLAYPSTLYVSVKGITPPETMEPTSRSMFATQPEMGRTTYDQLVGTAEFGATIGDEKRYKGPPLWSRLPGQVCRIPNTMMLSLPAGGKGCFVVRFSHDGRSLACAGHDKDSYPIYVYEIPTGKVKGQFLGHYSLVYDLCWSRNNKQLLSACADGTARVWDAMNMASAPTKVMPHPTFVYAAQFHPRITKVVVTGCYDRILRVWTTQGDEITAQLLQEIEGHTSHINTICFGHDEAGKMFTGDGAGVIRVWNVYVTDQPSKKGVLRDWTLNQEIIDEEFKGVSINFLKVHPNGGRLLVHTRDNKIRLFDLRRNGVMVKYQGAVNMRERLRSTLSPCGSFVVTGSEDNAAYIWRAETGDQVASYLSLGYKSAVVDVDFHPHDHMLAMCAFSANHPVLVYKFDYRVAQREAGIEPQDTIDVGMSLKKSGRPGSPEIRQGGDKSDDEGLETARSLQMTSARDDYRVQEKARLERVQRKLAVVNAFKPSPRPMSPMHPLGVPGMTSAASNVGVTGMLSTRGSTFDSTSMYTALVGDRALALITPRSDQLDARGSPMPSYFSPHASRTLQTSMQQQQLASQADYMRESGSGWRPSFSPMGRPGAMYSDSPLFGHRPAQSHMSLTSQGGRSQFSFQAPGGAVGSRFQPPGDQRPGIHLGPSRVVPHSSARPTLFPGPGAKVVALYDYQGQRSDEISFLRGDILTVVHKENDNWWMAEAADGTQGYIPVNYVTPATDDDFDDKQPGGPTEDDVRGSKTHAIVTKSGDLRFISEESDADSTPRKVKKKKKTVTMSQDTILSMESEMSTPVRPARKKKAKGSRKVEESEA